MAEGGVPAIGAGAGDAGDSPLPAGYGSLEAGFPAAEPEALERRRAARGDEPSPVRPWARRAPRQPVDAPPPVPAAAPPAAPPNGTAAGGPARPRDVEVEEGPVHGTRRPRQNVRLVRGVRSRRLVRRVDVWTVCKVSLVFYFLGLVVMLVAGVILWNVAGAFGFIHTIEKSVRTLFSLKTFTLHPGSTLAYAAGIGALLCVVGVVVNTLAAVTYNLISDLVGGVQVVVVTEPE